MKMQTKVTIAWAVVWAEILLVALYGSLLLVKYIA